MRGSGESYCSSMMYRRLQKRCAGLWVTFGWAYYFTSSHMYRLSSPRRSCSSCSSRSYFVVLFVCEPARPPSPFSRARAILVFFFRLLVLLLLLWLVVVDPGAVIASFQQPSSKTDEPAIPRRDRPTKLAKARRTQGKQHEIPRYLSII